MCDGVTKFHKRLHILSTNSVASALHTFGNENTFKVVKNQQTSIAKSLVKRAQRKPISVKPTSVQRRKRKNGSRKALSAGGHSSTISSADIPSKIHLGKRKHSLSQNIAQNVPPAKKHADNMTSKSKPRISKKTAKKD